MSCLMAMQCQTKHDEVADMPHPFLLQTYACRIAALPAETFFWLGAGEVDLKVGLHAQEFVRAYGAHVVDCTYDEAPQDLQSVSD